MCRRLEEKHANLVNIKEMVEERKDFKEVRVKVQGGAKEF